MIEVAAFAGWPITAIAIPVLVVGAMALGKKLGAALYSVAMATFVAGSVLVIGWIVALSAWVLLPPDVTLIVTTAVTVVPLAFGWLTFFVALLMSK